MKYIRNWLKPFDAYMQARLNDNKFPEDSSHELSCEVIEAWRDSKKLKGFVTVPDFPANMNTPSPAPAKKGHGKGKSRVFSFNVVAAPSRESSDRGSHAINLLKRAASSMSSHSYSAALKGDDRMDSMYTSSYNDDCAENLLYDTVNDDEENEYTQPFTKMPKVAAGGHTLLKKLAVANQVKQMEYTAKFANSARTKAPVNDGDNSDQEQGDADEEVYEEEEEEEVIYGDNNY